MPGGGTGEPGEGGGFVLRHAIAVEEELAEQGLGLGVAGVGELAQERGALFRRAGQAGGDLVGGEGGKLLPGTGRGTAEGGGGAWSEMPDPRAPSPSTTGSAGGPPPPAGE